MLAIGNYSYITFIILIAFSLIPVIFFLGKIFTRNGRDALAANPLMFLYFIIFFVYGYFFWTNPMLIYDYLKINGMYQKLIYGALAVVPFFERDLPN